MATDTQKEELVEALKGPHYYRVMIWGYGGEASYSTIPEAAAKFWQAHGEEYGDSDLIAYCTNAQEYTAEQFRNGEADVDWDELDPADLTDEVCFLHDQIDDIGRPWYEPPNEFDHVWGAGAESARITVEKVDSSEYNAKYISDVLDGEELYELVNRVGEETDYEVELTDSLDAIGREYTKANKGEYVFQFYSSEKGTFFEAYLESQTLFDEKKLKFVVDEAPNGEDTVFAVMYDGEELDNQGGDTNGKGYYAHVWEQEW
jgi:hypothetical protein